MANSKAEALVALLREHTKPPESNPIKVRVGAPDPPILVWFNAPLARRVLGMTGDDEASCKNVHPRNRDSSFKRIERLAADILGGKWLATHQGGALDTKGRVLDFVHRLKAILLADKTKPGLSVPLWVSPNCDPVVFHVIDRGLARNQAHLFVAQGGNRTYANKVCAIGRSMQRGVAKGNFNLELDECVKVSLEHEHLIRAILAECKFGACDYYSNGWAGAFANYARFHPKGSEAGFKEIQPLLRRFVTQADGDKVLPPGDPMKVFYDFLRKQKGKQSQTVGHFRDWVQYPYAVTTIRHALSKRSLTEAKLKSLTVGTTLDKNGKDTIYFKVEDFGPGGKPIKASKPTDINDVIAGGLKARLSKQKVGAEV